MKKRLLRQPSDSLADGSLGLYQTIGHVGLGVQARERLNTGEAIADARGMGQEVANRDLALRRDALERTLAVCRADNDLRILELWDEERNRVIELETALFVKHQNRHASDRLGHRGDPKDRVFAHRNVVVYIPPTEGLSKDDPSTDSDQTDRSRDVSLVDGFL